MQFTEYCPSCCMDKGLKCSRGGKCLCPKGLAGKCCDKDEHEIQTIGGEQRPIYHGMCFQVISGTMGNNSIHL